MGEIKIKNTTETLTAQNLIREAKKEPSRFRSPEFYKPVIVDSLTLLSALWVGHEYAKFLGEGKISLLAASLIALGILSTIQIFLPKTFGRRALIIALESVCILIPFRAYDMGLLAISWMLMFLFILWGEFLSNGELENNLDIRFIKTARPTLKKFTTALTLAMVILYIPQWNQTNIFIPREGFKNFYGWFVGIAQDFYPEINFNSSFGDFAKSLARLEFQKNDAFNNLGQIDQEKIIEQTTSQITADINKTAGLSMSSAEPTHNVFYRFLIIYLEGLKERFGNSFILAWAAAVFLLVRGFGIIFYWVVTLVGLAIYNMLIAAKFIRIAGIPKTHEVIQF